MDRIRTLLLARTHVVVMDPDLVSQAATAPARDGEVEKLEDALAQLGFVLSLDLGTTLRFRDGPGRDLSDVVYAAQLRDITGECVYDRRGGVRVDMNVVVLGERGPAAQPGSRSGEVEYFVAILDPRETILAKERFTSRLDFAPGQERVAIREELEQRIPLPQGTSAQDYRILVGFQMNPDEAELVRRHRQGGR